MQEKEKLEGKSSEKKFTKTKKSSKYAKRKDDFRGKGPIDLHSGPNDAKWRTADELSTKLAASLPFGYPQGMSIDGLAVQLGSNVNNRITVPGIMTLWTYVTLGTAQDYNSACNLAARKVYSFVRHANSGSKNYEAADMMMIFGAEAQALAMIGWLVRVYRTLDQFAIVNRYQPRELIRAQGVDYDDIVAHQAELAWLIRWAAKSLNSLAFPDMPYFHAAYESFLHYYIDKNSPKRQVYMLTPFDILCYDPVGSATGATLSGGKIANWPIAGMSTMLLTYADIVAAVHTVFDVLLSDEDIGLVSGDILKAYGEGGLYKVEAPVEGADIFIHSEEMLQQFHNATTIGDITNSLSYSENPGTTSTAPYIVSNWGGSAPYTNPVLLKFYIDAFSDAPDAVEVVNCTALKPGVTYVDNVSPAGYVAARIDHDILVPMTAVITSGIGANANLYSIVQPSTRPRLNPQPAGPTCYYTQFDWHPLVFIVDNVSTYEIGILGDTQNINFFDMNVLTRIHENSMLNLFELMTKGIK